MSTNRNFIAKSEPQGQERLQVFGSAFEGENGCRMGPRKGSGDFTGDEGMDISEDTTSESKLGDETAAEVYPSSELKNGHDGVGVRGQPAHKRTVQALRKYLQRKLSSEDSSSERESPQERETYHRSLDSECDRDLAATSTLTCSIVYPSTGRHVFPIEKQRSLDESRLPSDSRYLRTDLCVPILLSRCNFCDRSFELEDQLRAHIRDVHWHYFLEKGSKNYQSCEVLDLSVRKLTETGSLPNLNKASSSFDLSPSTHPFQYQQPSSFKSQVATIAPKKPVKCITCGKGFSTKWNWKQHQKIHLRENLQAFLQ